MREVTERDFRMPEYRDAKVEDYEFRADGKLVRKDRWERGIQRIRELVGINDLEFEISDVIEEVERLVDLHRRSECGQCDGTGAGMDGAVIYTDCLGEGGK